MSGLILLRCFNNALQVFRPFGPRERTGILIVLVKVPSQVCSQVPFRAMHTLTQSLLGENTEETFNQVEPRSMSWDVVEMDARVRMKPLLSCFILVNV